MSHEFKANPLKIVKAKLSAQKLTHCVLVDKQFLNNLFVSHLVAVLAQQAQMLVILWQLRQSQLAQVVQKSRIVNSAEDLRASAVEEVSEI